MSREQRRDPRFESNQDLWCEGQPRLQARNISRSGMFVVANDGAELGSTIKVSFMDGDQEIAANVEVMWRGQPGDAGKTGLGLKIVGFDKGEEAYERFVERHLESTRPPTDEPDK